MVRWGRSRVQPIPRDLIHEAQLKLDQAAGELRSDEETTEAEHAAEARVAALEYRVDVIYDRAERHHR